MAAGPYRGRFAPSPTGRLHFGSLVAALGSYLDARHQAGEWLVRIEDIDRERERPGAADAILSTLEAFGFEWDREVVYQSRRTELYRSALARLLGQGVAYRCSCSRREVASIGVAGVEGPIYPGRCRTGHDPSRETHAIRLRTHGDEVAFIDRLHGELRQRVEQEVGDFVIRRADGMFAYQLAVVVDDAEQGITDVVRGADLLRSTARQIHLQHLLGVPTPGYLHLPLVRDALGRKLSKQDLAHPVDPLTPLPSLCAAVRFLGQSEPPEGGETVEAFWRWAITHWDPRRITAAPLA